MKLSFFLMKCKDMTNLAVCRIVLRARVCHQQNVSIAVSESFLNLLVDRVFLFCFLNPSIAWCFIKSRTSTVSVGLLLILLNWVKPVLSKESVEPNLIFVYCILFSEQWK